jgi:anti-sigma factor RsiW
MTCGEYQDIVAAHVDGQLNPTEMQAVNTHLQSCVACRERFAEEQRFHLAFTARRVLLPPPPSVVVGLHKALARESSPLPSWRQRLFAHRVSLFSFFFSRRLATAVVVTGLILAFWWLPTTKPDLFASAVKQYELATTDQFVFAYVVRDPRKLEQSFNDSGQLDFTTHVLDFRPFGYRIRGGHIVRLNGHPTAVTIYRGPEADIVCLRQRGALPPLPPGALRVGRDLVYTYEQYTVLVIQESDLFCMLVSRLPRDVFLRSFGYRS